MQESMDRRDPHAARVPLDDVLVELAPAGFDESFEADGLDLGPGGLSMRASILPEVGAKLRCRFQSPHDGSSIDADGEVVWAEDSGPHLGEFGLRFTDLSSDDALNIERLVQAWRDEFAAGNEDPSTEPGMVALELEGVSQRVEAHVLHDTHDALLVEQPLPFLTIGKGVREGGRKGMLAAVDLRIDGDVPKLVLTIGFDEVPSAESTLLEAPAPTAEPAEALDDSLAGEEFEDDSLGADAASLLDDVASMDEPVVGASIDEDEVDDEAEDEVRAKAHGREADFSRSFQLADPADDEPSLEEPSASIDAELEAMASKPGAKVAAQVKTFAPKVKAWAILVWAKTLPLVRRYWARTRHVAGSLRRRIRPALGKAAAKVKRGEKKEARTPRKRRTTRAPAADRDARPRAGEASEGAPKPKRKVGRYVLAGAVVLAVAVYAWPSSAAPSAIALAKTGKIAPEPEPMADPELGDPGELAAPAPTAEEIVAGEDIAPLEPSAMPEPAREAGRLDLAGGARPSAAPREVPADSPYAAEPAPEGARRFGDESPRGPQFRIRMGEPVRGLTGTRTDRGFEVRIPGNRAAEGARRIASVHPRVSRARVDNEAGGAVLRIDFVGDAPKFEVRAAGAAVLITIER